MRRTLTVSIEATLYVDDGIRKRQVGKTLLQEQKVARTLLAGPPGSVEGQQITELVAELGHQILGRLLPRAGWARALFQEAKRFPPPGDKPGDKSPCRGG